MKFKIVHEDREDKEDFMTFKNKIEKRIQTIEKEKDKEKYLKFIISVERAIKELLFYRVYPPDGEDNTQFEFNREVPEIF